MCHRKCNHQETLILDIEEYRKDRAQKKEKKTWLRTKREIEACSLLESILSTFYVQLHQEKK